MIIDWLNVKLGRKTTKVLVIIWYILLILLILTCMIIPQGRIKYLDW